MNPFEEAIRARPTGNIFGDETISRVGALIGAVKEAKRLEREVRKFTVLRDQALGEITKLIGGDKLQAIRNAEQNIGELLTREFS